MFVCILFGILISAILLVRSEETPAIVNSRNKNIVPVSAELRLKIETIEKRRLKEKKSFQTEEAITHIILHKKCYCRNCSSINSRGAMQEKSRYTICCVPKTHAVCCKTISTHNLEFHRNAQGLLVNHPTTPETINLNNAIHHFYPIHFEFVDPKDVKST